MVRAVFIHDTYYGHDDAGDVYAYGAFPYDLWAQRFLPHFDHVTVVGRDKGVVATDCGLDRSDGENVSFCLLPNVNTPLRRVFGSKNVRQAIEAQIVAHDAVIVRGPVEFAMMAGKLARKHGKPFAVEMSGCAFDHSWYHGALIGKLYAPVKYVRAKAMVRYADFVVYVTEHFLQRRYPTKARRVEHASNVDLVACGAEILERRLARIEDDQGRIVFGMIANFGNKLKGLSVFLESLSRVKDRLGDFELRVLGHGPVAAVEAALPRYGLEGRVVFSGSLPGGEAVCAWLDDIDVYVQPSFHEGLPRALIEAMSRGCPALASDAGGSGELLAADEIHRRGDVDGLALGLLLARDRLWQRGQAQRNFEAAKAYGRDVLMERRERFWAEFRDYSHST